ncbi:MAG TPA: proline--tRNA ligase [Thermoanaerobaculia bacterium]|nr:proline--tRNA ligase [Thermoanaerobaculia bacterium]HUM30901.1 proline--tRNA ligase [Thermoanaerobaculia bacterium]HXK69211.1 proline--tRNA ligase [Thermoanaerobaculia bacterium]
MKYSRFFIPTLREAPAEAEVVSHGLMLRAGMIQKVAAGIYDYLPLGLRSIKKLEAIIREEMNGIGGAELLMPAISPSELWVESGRWFQYGKELLRMQDRHDREFCFGPTHEEVITDIVRKHVRSYRQLPITLYQIQTKFRDEIRPRFGLMRGREFIMKDAYSFHATRESLDETYQDMHRAYCRIFERCRLDYTRVEADTGSIGGSESHEFMVLAGTGEDVVFHCPSCGYGANAEKAETAGIGVPLAPHSKNQAVQEVPTPGVHTVEEVAAFLNVPLTEIIKTLILETDREFVAVLIRGDREVNEIKVKNYLGCSHIQMAGPDKIEKLTGGPVGFSGPVGLKGVRILADLSLEGMKDGVSGGNRLDTHLLHVDLERDVSIEDWADFRMAAEGDPCPRCGASLTMFRGIEVGHIFKLGTKYSEPMKCLFLDEAQQEQSMIMGCYGLGVGRTVAAAIEQSHDEKGIVWPIPLAPFVTTVLPLNPNDSSVADRAEKYYQDLQARGMDALHDDRNERAGIKFHDAELMGIPFQLIVGSRGLERETVEIGIRKTGEKIEVHQNDAIQKISELIED